MKQSARPTGIPVAEAVAQPSKNDGFCGRDDEVLGENAFRSRLEAEKIMPALHRFGASPRIMSTPSFCRIGAGTLALSAICAALHAGPPAAVVRHAPTLNGAIEGSVQQLLGENVTLNGGASITGDLLVPGTPTLRLNGNGNFGGTIPGSGAAAPAGYTVTLNGNARLGYLRTRTDAVTLPSLPAPATPAGTRSVTVNGAGQTIGDFTGVRHLTLNGNAGPVAVPAGAYGDFTANGSSGFTLGVAGAIVPASYAFQSLTLNGQAQLRILGPVVVTVAKGVSINGDWGAASQPAWLVLNVHAGGVTLNGNSSLHGFVTAPSGSITVNGNARIVGGVVCDRLTMNGNGLLRGVAAAPNQPPVVALTSPANGAQFQAPATILLAANASDPDGTIARVEFFQGATPLGATTVAPYQFNVTGLPAGSHTFAARATDNIGATTDSSPVTIVVAGINLPPTVALTAPLAGTLFNFPATITLAATAQDPDGSIARVEFYQGGNRLGESRQAPFNFVWTGMLPGTYALSAKAYDNLNAVANSPAAAVTIQAALPYFTDFEGREGYTLGALDGQGGWIVSGSATNSDQGRYAGERGVVVAATSPATRISQGFPPYAGQSLVYLDFFAKLAAGDTTATSSEVRVEGAKFALVRDGAEGELQVFHGNGAGVGVWQRTGHRVTLRADGQSAAWLRLTVRQDFAVKQWDLYADGRLIASDVGMLDNSVGGFSRFEVVGATNAEVLFDSLYLGFDHPLFPDADHDGMDDAWELARGLNPTVNDRQSDLDGDGLSNLREYRLGLRPDSRDTDGDGLPDGWEVRFGLQPLVADATADPDGDGVTNLDEYRLGRDPTKGAVTDTSGAVNLRIYSPAR